MKRIALGLFTICIAACLMLSGCSRRPGTVEGTVTNSANGQALPGATVVVYTLGKAEGADQLDIYTKELILAKTQTDEQGAYTFSLIAARYIVEVWVGGYDAGSRMVEVKSNRTLTVDFSVDNPRALSLSKGPVLIDPSL